MRSKVLAAFGLAALLASAASAALFTEDFESLSIGELNGQSGWSTVDGLPVSSSGQLSSRVLAGILAGGDPTLHYASHGISLVGQTGQISLSFDAFGLAAQISDGLYSHNSGMGFGFGGTSIAAGWTAYLGIGWVFDVSGLTGIPGSTELVFQGMGEAVSFEVVIDRVVGEVFGRYTFSTGSGETAHFAISDSNVDLLTSLSIQQDLTLQIERTGVDIDNIRVVANAPTSVPEPFTMALGMGGAFVGFRRMRRKRTIV